MRDFKEVAVPAKNQLLYFHGTTVDGHRFTISGKFTKDAEIDLGLAICSNRDQFSKGERRVISSRRLEDSSIDGKGKCITSLYSTCFDNWKKKGNAKHEENWFIGIESKIFVGFCSRLTSFSAAGLQKGFNLYHNKTLK